MPDAAPAAGRSVLSTQRRRTSSTSRTCPLESLATAPGPAGRGLASCRTYGLGTRSGSGGRDGTTSSGAPDLAPPLRSRLRIRFHLVSPLRACGVTEERSALQRAGLTQRVPHAAGAGSLLTSACARCRTCSIGASGCSTGPRTTCRAFRSRRAPARQNFPLSSPCRALTPVRGSAVGSACGLLRVRQPRPPGSTTLLIFLVLLRSLSFYLSLLRNSRSRLEGEPLSRAFAPIVTLWRRLCPSWTAWTCGYAETRHTLT